MNRCVLEDNIRKTVWTKLCSIWDIENKSSDTWGIGNHYWYPLAECNREDLISFNSRYVIKLPKLEDVKKILLQLGANVIYEFREDGSAYKIDNIEEYDFWNSDDYFWNNEGFWVDNDMDFIIYLSHEETVTFGGEHFIKEIKSHWLEWAEYLKWDTKNK